MLFRLYSHSQEIAVTLEEKRELKVRLSRCSEIRRYWSCLRWLNEVRELKHSGVQKVWSQTRWVTFSVTQLSVRWEFKGFGRKKWQRNQNKCSQPTCNTVKCSVKARTLPTTFCLLQQTSQLTFRQFSLWYSECKTHLKSKHDLVSQERLPAC